MTTLFSTTKFSMSTNKNKTKNKDKLNDKQKKQPKAKRGKTKLSSIREPLPNKYVLYEASVQDAPEDARILSDIYKELRGKEARSFREDFCGTFSVACEWVKLHPQNTAIGLDIDTEPLEYGRKNHFSKLSPDQQRRMNPLKRNVISTTKPGSDLVAACNFSYWCFKDRKTLTRYFKEVYKSLNSDGLFFMDIVGGTEMYEEHEDTERYGKGKDKFKYIWRQEKFNPINNEGFFSISYEFKDGRKMPQAFTYDWRIWSIREVRECLEEAGFKKSWIYWEQEDEDGEPNGEFEHTEEEENCICWIAYIVAAKN